MPIFKWLQSNVVSILLALMLALTVWIIATQEANPVQEAELDRPVPVEIGGLQDGLTITNNPSLSTIVRVRAPQSTWLSLTPENFVATVDLSDYGPGTHTVLISIRVVGAQAVADGARPNQVRVTLEEVGQRANVAIQLVLDGSLPTGYRSRESVIQPASVTIRGARSKVDLVGEVRATARVDGLRETFEGSLPLVALDSDGNPIDGLTLIPAFVSVTIPIFQEADFAQLAVRVNANVQPAPGYYITNITADPPLVSVRGTPDILRTLTTIETQPVNLTGLDTDTRIPAQLNPPEGVTLEGTQIVDVIITVEAQSAFRSFEVPIRAIGLGSGLSATILPRSAVVTISGPLPVLDALDELEDIIVSVDLTDLEPDSYQVEPEVQIINIPEDDLRELEIESVLPTLIQVEITEEGASP